MKSEPAGGATGTSKSMPPTDKPLVYSSASQLVHQLTTGEVSAVEVVDAHIARILEANPAINAVVQPLFDEARMAARAADEAAVRARRSGERLPVLHGVPVTVKDCFDVRGTDCTLGVDHLAGRPAPADAPLVSRLRAAGAIILGKTNVHQGMLMHEADNPLFGRTNHPLDGQRSPGGSSGGEAAIVAAGGSALGLASDMGGSIRQPAHSCGICGLKPTRRRLSARGSHRAMPGMQAIDLQPGPLVRDVGDIDLAMRALVDKRHVPRQDDETADPWPDYRKIRLTGLRIGWLVDDGYFRPAPAIRRAVEHAAHVLQDAGARIESFSLPQPEDVMRLYMGLISADGLQTMSLLLHGSRKEPQVAHQLRMAAIPRSARKFLRRVLPLLGQDYLADLVHWAGKRSAKDYWDLTAESDDYRRMFQQRFSEAGCDALVMPAHGLPALRHRSAFDVLSASGYCLLANLIGWPASVVPFSTVDSQEESDRPISRDRVIRRARAVEAGSRGLPVGVQVLASPWREDIILALMRILEQANSSSDRQ